MEDWLQQLLEWLPEGGSYLVLLLFIALFESLPVIGLIMPGSTLVVLAGFLAVHGKGSLPALMLCCGLGALLGDLLSYWLGGRLGQKLLTTRPFRRRRRRRLVQQAETFFAQHGGKSLFFARFLGPLRGMTPFVAGAARMRPGPFCRYTLISALLWGLSYPGIGYLGGASWEHAQQLSTRLGLLIGLALAVTIAHILLRRGTRSLKFNWRQNTVDIQLDQVEARILGSFIEKELTTPDHYPLSLNALTNACNQKSNRQPVMELEETSLLRSLDRLRHLGLAMQSQGTGSRVAKYRHTLREKLHLDEAELAILAELLLRGPQTLGELRGRADRMQSLPSLEAAEEVLQELLDRDQPLAIKLPRQAGRKECRYAHLLCGPPEEEVTDAPAEPARLQVQAENERIARLEEELTVLRQEMNELKQELAAFRAQFE